MAMVNYPYNTDFVNPLPANPVYEACKAGKIDSSDPSDFDYITGISKVTNLFYNYEGDLPCYDITDGSP